MTPWCRTAQEYAQEHLPDVAVFSAELNTPMPDAARGWSGDFILSFLSPWIVPRDLLQRARVAAINFHPGPPEYPGIGCYNFALYDGVPRYGVTCHHMEPSVDRGRLVAVSRFEVRADDSVETLKERSMVAMLDLFKEIIDLMARGADLPVSDEHWTRTPYTRRELNELGRIEPGMSPDEVRRRVRAMAYPGAPGAFVEVGGVRFWA